MRKPLYNRGYLNRVKRRVSSRETRTLKKFNRRDRPWRRRNQYRLKRGQLKRATHDEVSTLLRGADGLDTG